MHNALLRRIARATSAGGEGEAETEGEVEIEGMVGADGFEG